MKNENNLCELVFIIDKSGSMSGLEGDTIGGFNSMIKQQRAEKGSCFVSTVLFDTHCAVLHDRVNIRRVKLMKAKDYIPGGCTALLDAVGGAIHHIGNIHKYARKEDVPSKTLFVIITDGMENASHSYTCEKVKKMVERQKEKYGWEFIFLGANIDALTTAKGFGIEEEFATNYMPDAQGTKNVYEAVNQAVNSVRFDCPMGCWKEGVENDYENRK